MTELRKHVTSKEAPIGAGAEWIKTYNALQDRINGFLAAGRNVPEELLNGSHNMVNSVILNNYLNTKDTK